MSAVVAFACRMFRDKRRALLAKLTCQTDCSRLLDLEGPGTESFSINNSYVSLDWHKHAIQTPQHHREYRAYNRIRPNQTLCPTDTHLASVYEPDPDGIDLLDVPSACRAKVSAGLPLIRRRVLCQMDLCFLLRRFVGWMFGFMHTETGLCMSSHLGERLWEFGRRTLEHSLGGVFGSGWEAWLGTWTDFGQEWRLRGRKRISTNAWPVTKPVGGHLVYGTPR